VSEALELRHDDLHATNTKDAPERVKPAPLKGTIVNGGHIEVRLKPASWNVIHLAAN
jgi:alpha-L-arabinofuranosidase